MSNIAKDLALEPPRSPRARLGGYILAARMIDKGRASLSSTSGEYYFSCALDNILFRFKGITGAEVRALLAAGATDEEVIEWIDHNGTPKTPEEIRTWSNSLLTKQAAFFEYLESDDRALLSKPRTSSLPVASSMKSVQ